MVDDAVLISESDQLLRRAFTEQLLAWMAPRPGWAVLKGAAQLPLLPGDLDLLVDPAITDTLLDEVAGWLGGFVTDGGFVVRCDHIPRVPRLIARLPAHGFGSSALEIDFVEALPVRANPVVTFAKLTTFVTHDRGFPALAPPAERAVLYLSRELRWTRAIAPVPRDALPALRRLVGPFAARLAVDATKHRVSAVAFSGRLLLGAARSPSLVLARARWWLAPAPCSFDPRRGRAARDVRAPAGAATGHVTLVGEWEPMRGVTPD